nr:MAG TPA: hypothetical protein [Caudoviricetes sp.]
MPLSRLIPVLINVLYLIFVFALLEKYRGL